MSCISSNISCLYTENKYLKKIKNVNNLISKTSASNSANCFLVLLEEFMTSVHVWPWPLSQRLWHKCRWQGISLANFTHSFYFVLYKIHGQTIKKIKPYHRNVLLCHRFHLYHMRDECRARASICVGRRVWRHNTTLYSFFEILEN